MTTTATHFTPARSSRILLAAAVNTALTAGAVLWAVASLASYNLGNAAETAALTAAIFGAHLTNSVLLRGVTGRSVGDLVTGTAWVDPATGRAVGVSAIFDFQTMLLGGSYRVSAEPICNDEHIYEHDIAIVKRRRFAKQ